MFKALTNGADGVMITGCHQGECHYLEQNYKALRRFHLIRRTLKGLGVEPERVKLVWASAAEGAKFTNEVRSFVEEIRTLGPLNWGGTNGRSSHGGGPSIPELTPENEEVPA